MDLEGDRKIDKIHEAITSLYYIISDSCAEHGRLHEIKAKNVTIKITQCQCLAIRFSHMLCCARCQIYFCLGLSTH